MPVFDRTDTPDLHIDKVEITGDTTFIYCTYYAEEDSWANISKGTYLEDVVTNKRYPILRVVGLPYEPGRRTFECLTEHPVIFCFPKITANKFDFIEKKNEKAFNIYGIDLQERFSESYSKFQLDRFQEMFDFFMTSNDTVKALGYKENEYKAIEYIYGRKSIPLCYKIIESSQLFIDTKDYNKALHYSQIEFSIIKDNFHENDTTYLLSLIELARCYSLTGNYAESVSLCRDAVKIMENYYEKNDDYILIINELIRNLYNHGENCAELGKYGEAISVYKEAIDLLRKNNSDVENCASFSYNLAKLYAEIDSFDIATSIMTYVVETRKQYLEEGDARYIESLNHLAEYCSRLNHYQDAVRYGEETIRCIKKMEVDPRRTLMIGLNNLAQYYADVDSFDRAGNLMLESIKIQKELESPQSQYLESLSLLVDFCKKKEDYKVALDEGKDAIRHIELIEGKSEDYYNCLDLLAGIYEKMDSIKMAIVLSEQYLNYHKGFNDTLSSDYLFAKMRLARCYSAIKQYGKAVSIQEEVVSTLSNNEKEQESYAISLCILSDYYQKNNQKQKALLIAEKSFLEFRPFMEDRLYEFSTIFLRNYANCYIANEVYDKSLGLYKKSAHLLDSLVGKNDFEYAETMNLLASNYEKMDSLEQAITIMKSITDSWERLHNKNANKKVEWLNNLAYYYSRSHRYIDALEIGKHVEGVIKELDGEESERYSDALDNLANYYDNLFDYSSAITIGKKALEIQKNISGELSPKYIQRLNNLASHYIGIDDSITISLFQYSLSLQSKMHIPDSVSICTLNNLACAYGVSDKTKAINILSKAVDICDGNKSNETLLYAQLLENRATYYNEMYYYEDAIKDCELANKIVFRILGANNVKYVLGLRQLSDYYKNNKDYEKSLSLISKCVYIAKNIYAENHSRHMSDYESLYWYHFSSLFFDYLPDIVSKCPTDSAVSFLYNSMLFSKGILLRKYIDDIQWIDIKKVLNDDDIAIEFVCPQIEEFGINGMDTYYALIIKKDLHFPKVIKLFDTYDKIHTGAIGELVWTPLLEELKGIRNIYFSPIGYLSTIPIENSSVGKIECISDNFNIYRLSSTRELLNRRMQKSLESAAFFGGIDYNQTDTITNVFYLGDNYRNGFEPLHYTKEEVETICSLLKSSGVKSELFMGDKGTERSFMNLSSKGIDILHLSTHGRYVNMTEANKERINNNLLFIQLSDNPFNVYEDRALSRSFLLLSGSNKLISRESFPDSAEDGFLTAMEISKTDLSGVDLVVLSACESGQGDFGADGGILGLQRGFKKAGANTILMSLDKVDDEATKILMVDFYKNLMSGKTKLQSLKDAQKYLRQVDNGKYDKPEYWAAFIMLDGIN